MKQTFFIFLLLISTESKKTIQLIISFILLSKTIFYLNLIPRIRKILNMIESITLISSFVFSCCSYFIDEKFPIFLKGFLLLSFFLIHGFVTTLITFMLGKEVLSNFRKKIKKTFVSFFSMVKNEQEKKKILKFGEKRKMKLKIVERCRLNKKF